MTQPFWKTEFPFLIKLNMYLPCGPATLPTGISPREMKTYLWAKPIHDYSWQLFSDLPKTGNNSRHVFNWWMDRQIVVYSHSGKPLRTEKNAVLIHAATRMDLRSILLSEASWSQRPSYNLQDSTDRTFWKSWNYRTESRWAVVGARVGRESDKILGSSTTFLWFVCDGGYTPPCHCQHS